MDHLFWRVTPEMEDHQFAWILWYIWKGKNNKVFSNMDIDPCETLRLAETESVLWTEAQITITQRTDQARTATNVTIPSIPCRWCFTDESWKDGEIFS